MVNVIATGESVRLCAWNLGGQTVYEMVPIARWEHREAELEKKKLLVGSVVAESREAARSLMQFLPKRLQSIGDFLNALREGYAMWNGK